MNTENNLAHLYSELSLNPNLPTLAERCNLLTEILLDCHSLPQTQPVCRCLGAYLEEVKSRDKKSGCWKIQKRNVTTAGR